MVLVFLYVLLINFIYTHVCDLYDKDRIFEIEQYIQKNKETLSSEDIGLINFIAGNCLPIVYIPGLYGNKLQLWIKNCTELNEHHPELSKSCGYDKKCYDNYEHIFWLSEKFETNNNSTCLGYLGRLNIVKESDGTYKEEELRGAKITYFGNTPNTIKDNECGFGASENVLDKIFYYGKKNPKGTLFFKNHFLSLGYKVGINLFSVPYDWRRSVNDNQTINLVKDAVNLAYKLNNKKVLLIGHSYGTMVALNYIYSMPIEERENKLARYVALAPPFLGANKIIKSLILGMEEFNSHIKILFDIINIFFSIQNQKLMQNSTPSMFQLIPRSFWKLYEKQEWMQVIIKRARIENLITSCVRDYFNNSGSTMKYEKENTNAGARIFHDMSHTNEDDEILKLCINPIIEYNKNDLKLFKNKFSFFPDLINGCSKVEVNDSTCGNLSSCKISIWDRYCRINMFLPIDNPVVDIKFNSTHDRYDLLSYINIRQMLEKYGIGKFDLNYFDYVINTFNKDLETMPHPGIPVTIYYSNSVMTSVSYHINENPKNITDSDRLVIDVLGSKIIDRYGGDGTVQSDSLLIPPLKWSLEHNNIHMVNYCSNSGFFSFLPDMSRNQYMNIGCRCDKPSTDLCSHSGFIGDQNLFDHLSLYAENSENKLKNWKESIDIIGRNVSTKMNCANLDNM